MLICSKKTVGLVVAFIACCW